MFGFNQKCDFKTFTFKNNLIGCKETARPLFRNTESHVATVANNTRIHLKDAEKVANKPTGEKIGLEAPLKFQCGVHEELTVDGWQTRPTKSP